MTVDESLMRDRILYSFKASLQKMFIRKGKILTALKKWQMPPKLSNQS
jgi:hypothetical protein